MTEETKLPLSRRLFLDGHDYDLSLRLVKGESDAPDLEATFEEVGSARGDLRIDGERIQRLVLFRELDKDKGQAIVLLEAPGGVESVPAGRYELLRVYVAEKRKDNPFYAAYEKPIVVEPGATMALEVGGPLNHSVTAHRERADRLRLEYRLEGRDGREYEQLWRDGRTSAPQVAIYHNDRQLTSGAFEYG